MRSPKGGRFKISAYADEETIKCVTDFQEDMRKRRVPVSQSGAICALINLGADCDPAIKIAAVARALEEQGNG